MKETQTCFAPQLPIPAGVTDISFYQDVFDAVEVRRWNNEDGTVHVAELSIAGALFHLHEEDSEAGSFSPHTLEGTTVVVGLFVPDVDAIMDKVIKTGATVLLPAQTHDYGYRQAKIKDPFGHVWMIQARV